MTTISIQSGTIELSEQLLNGKVETLIVPIARIASIEKNQDGYTTVTCTENIVFRSKSIDSKTLSLIRAAIDRFYESRQ